MTLNEILERGITQSDNIASFKNRIALQFLNDYPIYDALEPSLLEEDSCDDGNIQGMSFVSTTLRQSSSQASDMWLNLIKLILPEL